MNVFLATLCGLFGASDPVVVQVREGAAPPDGATRIIDSFGDPALAARLGLDRFYMVDGDLASLRALDSVDEAYISEWRDDARAWDPLFDQLWGLNNTGQPIGTFGSGTPEVDIRWVAAMAQFVPRGSAVIVVVDSGCTPHPDLPVPVYSWAHDGGSPFDQCEHGTHVAGTALALHNDIGIIGVHPGAQLAVVRVLTGCGGNQIQLATGIVRVVDWAAADGHRVVINTSLQWIQPETLAQLAALYAWERGMLWVSAAGNYNWGHAVAYPAAYDRVLGVGAMTFHGVRASFSNWGPGLDVYAPGVNVLGPLPNGNWNYKSGTSMAAPHVAGVAALLWSHHPNATNQQVRDTLVMTGRNTPALTAPIVDAAAALESICYADCDANGTLNIDDFICFIERFAAGHPYANCDGSDQDPVFNVDDFTCFLNEFAKGCE